MSDWTQDEKDRLVAVVQFPPPWWIRAGEWAMLTGRLHRASDRWWNWYMKRAVRRLRASRWTR